MVAQRVVLFPMPFQSHFNSMLHLGSMLHTKGFSISIICTPLTQPNPENHPHFTFHTISADLSDVRPSMDAPVMSLLAIYNKKFAEPFKACLSNIVSDVKEESVMTCLITDVLWYFSQAVADALKLRRFILSTCNASYIYTLLGYTPVSAQYSSIEDMNSAVIEFPPLRIKELRTETLDTELRIEGGKMLREFTTSSGIIFNSFEEMESPSLLKLQEILSNPVFPLGPFHTFKSDPMHSDHSCISWLEKQPPKSVIYVCLGTVVYMERSAFLELAWGVAATNRPFLMVVRSGLVQNSNKCDDDDDQLLQLPNEFREIVDAGRGLVVSRAPQREVLAHPSVGGFWTHAGWNSILESVHGGVPMICLPFIADQMLNARYVSEVWRIGFYFEEKVDRAVVENVIHRLMEGKESEEMRGNIDCLKNKAKTCLEVGGSSYESLESLVHHLVPSNSS